MQQWQNRSKEGHNGLQEGSCKERTWDGKNGNEFVHHHQLLQQNTLESTPCDLGLLLGYSFGELQFQRCVDLLIRVSFSVNYLTLCSWDLKTIFFSWFTSKGNLDDKIVI